MRSPRRSPVLPLLLLLGACGGREPVADPRPSGQSKEELRELAGTWVLDVERYAADLLARSREGVGETLARIEPEEAADWARMRAELVSEDAERTALTLVLSGDGRFRVTACFGRSAHRPEGTPKTAEGTWRREGEVVVLLTTRENGKALDEPLDTRGAYRDGRITIRPDASAPFSVVLRRSPGE